MPKKVFGSKKQLIEATINALGAIYSPSMAKTYLHNLGTPNFVFKPVLGKYPSGKPIYNIGPDKNLAIALNVMKEKSRKYQKLINNSLFYTLHGNTHIKKSSSYRVYTALIKCRDAKPTRNGIRFKDDGKSKQKIDTKHDVHECLDAVKSDFIRQVNKTKHVYWLIFDDECPFKIAKKSNHMYCMPHSHGALIASPKQIAALKLDLINDCKAHHVPYEKKYINILPISWLDTWTTWEHTGKFDKYGHEIMEKVPHEKTYYPRLDGELFDIKGDSSLPKDIVTKKRQGEMTGLELSMLALDVYTSYICTDYRIQTKDTDMDYFAGKDSKLSYSQQHLAFNAQLQSSKGSSKRGNSIIQFNYSIARKGKEMYNSSAYASDSVKKQAQNTSNNHLRAGLVKEAINPKPTPTTTKTLIKNGVRISKSHQKVKTKTKPKNNFLTDSEEKECESLKDYSIDDLRYLIKGQINIIKFQSKDKDFKDANHNKRLLWAAKGILYSKVGKSDNNNHRTLNTDGKGNHEDVHRLTKNQQELNKEIADLVPNKYYGSLVPIFKIAIQGRKQIVQWWRPQPVDHTFTIAQKKHYEKKFRHDKALWFRDVVVTGFTTGYMVRAYNKKVTKINKDNSRMMLNYWEVMDFTFDVNRNELTLADTIKNHVLRILNDNINVNLSKHLAIRYKNNSTKNVLNGTVSGVPP